MVRPQTGGAISTSPYRRCANIIAIVRVFCRLLASFRRGSKRSWCDGRRAGPRHRQTLVADDLQRDLSGTYRAGRGAARRSIASSSVRHDDLRVSRRMIEDFFCDGRGKHRAARRRPSGMRGGSRRGHRCAHSFRSTGLLLTSLRHQSVTMVLAAGELLPVARQELACLPCGCSSFTTPMPKWFLQFGGHPLRFRRSHRFFIAALWATRSRQARRMLGEGRTDSWLCHPWLCRDLLPVQNAWLGAWLAPSMSCFPDGDAQTSVYAPRSSFEQVGQKV